MSQAQVSYVGASALEPASAQVAYIGAAATLIDANAGPDRTVRPLDTVTLIPVGQVGTFTQVSGTSVTILGTAPLQSYVAPAALAGAALVFRLTVTDGSLTDTDDVTHTVLPQQFWQVVAGVLKPLRRYLPGSGALAQQVALVSEDPPGSGLFTVPLWMIGTDGLYLPGAFIQDGDSGLYSVYGG